MEKRKLKKEEEEEGVGRREEAGGRKPKKKRQKGKGRWEAYGAVRACGATEEALEVPPHLLSRLLYANPVCLMTSWGEGGKRNVMVITWITPINNRGLFVASVKASRHSAGLVTAAGAFALSVPVRGMEPLLLRVGSCSGRDTDKLAEIDGLDACRVGWAREEDARDGGEEEAAFAVDACVAHLECAVLSREEVDAHHIMTCRVTRGFVLKRYWSGKTFAPRVPGAEPFLSFFGSAQFGAVVPVD